MGEWRVKYDGTCSRCGTALTTGTPAVWERSTRTIRCVECPSGAEIATGVAGGSARARYEHLAAKRDNAITERWGTGVAAKVVRAFTVEPQSTRAWAIGAAGEAKLAAALAEVPNLVVLNDRRVPGTKGNIDHIVIAPAGVFVVDAKAHKGMVAIRDHGWLLRSDLRLTVGGRDCSAMADKMGWQVDAVRGALDGIHDAPVVPVLCFTEAEWPVFRAPDSFRGVRLESPRSLVRLVSQGDMLDADGVTTIARALSNALPPK